MDAIEALEEFKEPWPKLYALAVSMMASVLDGESVEDGTYTSEDTDDSPWNYHGYFRVSNNKITAIGHELGREGGWFWLINRS